MVEVIQADRDRAAHFSDEIGARSRGERAAILNGHADDDCFVQAFAAHRIEVERGIVNWLRGDQAVGDIDVHNHFLASQIKQGAHRDV